MEWPQASNPAMADASVQPLPASLSFGQGAAVGVPYATAYRGLHHKAQARPGETVLVHGASGGVGIAAVQLAVAHGMTVIGTGGTERGRKLVAEHGAHHVLDHTAADYTKRVMEITEGRGADARVQVNFQSGGMKWLALEYAKLTAA